MKDQEEKVAATPAGLPEGITQEMIDSFKGKHGANNIRMASLPKDDYNEQFLHVLLKVPGRRELGEFEKFADRDPNKAKEILINACLLTSKDEVKASDDLYYSAINAISDLIPIRKAIIKKV